MSAGTIVFKAWDRPLDRNAVTFINENPVDPRVEGAAKAALLAAVIDLRLKTPPQLLWFRAALDVIPPQMMGALVKFDGTAFRRSDVIGLSYRGEPKAIGVLSTLGPEGAAEVAAHEVCHIAGVSAEQSALDYGERVAAGLSDVLAYFDDRGPQVHKLSYPPGRDIGLLAGFAKPGDLLKAPATHGGMPRCFVNVGGAGSPSWRRLA